MNFLIVTLILHITWTSATNLTEEATNKTKRTVAGQVQNYGENRPVLLYPEGSGHVPPQNLASLYAPVTLKPVFDSELPKQVAAQQVLYEFQQTPTNAVSNVHVNQFYQPVSKENASPAQYVSGSESVATPVQHSSLVRHGQNYAQVQYQPLPQHVQTHQYIPGKLLYVNGKIIYPQNGFQQQNHQLGAFAPQNVFQRPSYMYQHPQTMTQKLIPPPLVVRPAGYRRFSPPQPHQIQQITKPVPVPEVKEEQNEEEEEEQEDNSKREEEEVEEEDDEKESYEDDDEDHFSRYFDDDESYTEDDEDNERGSSKPVPKKQAKKPTKPNKYNKGDNFKYRESYTSSSKYEKPTKKVRKNTKSPKMHYTSVKYSKEGSGKPRGEKIEGKQSQNVPVVHKQKIFEKKWYVTKSMDDSSL